MSLTSAPFGEFTLAGNVSANATSALLGYRINTECDCLGTADFMLYEMQYGEPNAPGSHVPNPNFPDGIHAWGTLWGDISYRLSPHDLSDGQLLHVTAGPAQLAGMNSDVFSVTAGADYTVTFAARVSPTTTESGYFTIIFSPDTGNEAVRETVPVAPNG